MARQCYFMKKFFSYWKKVVKEQEDEWTHTDKVVYRIVSITQRRRRPIVDDGDKDDGKR